MWMREVWSDSLSLAGCSLADKIKNVPTRSDRKILVKKLLNNILQKNPECIYTIYALLTYSTQKWASQTRKQLEIDESRSNELRDQLYIAENRIRSISLSTGIMPGIWQLNNIERRRRATAADTDRILLLLEHAVNSIDFPLIPNGHAMAATLRAIHFAGSEWEDVSNYYVNTYYEKAVYWLHNEWGDDIRNMIMEAASNTLQLCQNDRFYLNSCHDTVKLINVYAMMSSRFGGNYGLSAQKAQRIVDALSLLTVVEHAVNAIRKLPDDGETMYNILLCKMLGQTDYEAKDNLKISRKVYDSRKGKAITLLSFLLWGYSTRDILEGLVLNDAANVNTERYGFCICGADARVD